jgi:hypothetical protein
VKIINGRVVNDDGSPLPSDLMFRSIADKVPWGDLSGVPASFAPSAHAASHHAAGSDALSLADLAGVLAKSQQHGSTLYADEVQTMTAHKIFTGGVTFQQTVSTRFVPPVDGNAVRFSFTDRADGSNTTGYVNSANSNSAGNRYIGLQALSDRDGTRIPVQFAVLDAAGAIVNAMAVLAGADAGKVAVYGAAAAGAEVVRLYLDNRSSTANTAVGMAFRVGSGGSTTVAEVVGRLPSATNGELLIRTRNGGALTEAVRIDSLQRARFAASVVIGGVGAAPSGNALLDLASTTKGLLIPGLTTVQRDAISATPEDGLTIRNLTTGRWETYIAATLSWQAHW